MDKVILKANDGLTSGKRGNKMKKKKKRTLLILELKTCSEGGFQILER